MISVKICGITSQADAELCVNAGARALGFVFYGLSPRAISPGAARDIVASLPPGIRKVGVFVNMKKEAVADVAQRVGLDMVQLSGDELVVDCQWLSAQGFKVIKAIRPRTSREVHKLADYKDHVFAFNVDAFREGQFGGTGQVADWSLARLAKQYERPVILSGGLNGATVVPALRAVEPSALDVCTGVEREPGKKDPKKLKGFFEALWRYDEELRRKAGAPAGAETGPIEGSGLSGRFEPRGGAGGIAAGGAGSPNLPRVKAHYPGARSGPIPAGGTSSGNMRRAAPPPSPLASDTPAVVLPALKPPGAAEGPGEAKPPGPPAEPEGPALVDIASSDPNRSAVVKRPEEEPAGEEPPLVDYASISALIKKPPAPGSRWGGAPPEPPSK